MDPPPPWHHPATKLLSSRASSSQLAIRTPTDPSQTHKSHVRTNHLPGHPEDILLRHPSVCLHLWECASPMRRHPSGATNSCQHQSGPHGFFHAPNPQPPQYEEVNHIDQTQPNPSLPAEFGDRSSMPLPPKENTFLVILGPDSEKLMFEST